MRRLRSAVDIVSMRRLQAATVTAGVVSVISPYFTCRSVLNDEDAVIGLELDDVLLGDHGYDGESLGNSFDWLHVDLDACGPAPAKRFRREGRIEMRTRINEDCDGHHRLRYHGQPRRGRQTHAALDKQDIELAMRAARIALVRMAAGRVDAETEGQIRLARRFIEDVWSR